jgi:hypothetical protein
LDERSHLLLEAVEARNQIGNGLMIGRTRRVALDSLQQFQPLAPRRVAVVRFTLVD